MRAALALVLAMLAACGAAAAPVSTPAPVLALPPSAATEATLARADAWTRIHYLLDLFDWARVTKDPASRALLLGSLGVTAESGTTDAALDALLVAVDQLLGRDRLDGTAQAARTLLEADRRPPADRRALFIEITAVKSIARGNGPLAANATLRLALFCAAAFRDAATMRARDRPAVLSSCLYPLFDTDPAPYFDPDPARRPPAPAWADLDDGLHQLDATLGKSASRVAPLAARVDEEQRRVVADAEARGLLPRALDPRTLEVPEVAAAPPYDWEPLVLVGDPTAAELARFEAELGDLLAGDGRGRVALVLTRDAPAAQLLPVAALARRLGATTIELAVGYTQKFRAPPGDYAAYRAPGGSALRLGIFPLLAPGGPGWDPARAGLGLTVVVAPRSWQIVAPSGAMAPIAVGADPSAAAAALRAQLAQLLDAFPDEAALLVAPDPMVTVGALVAAVATVRGQVAAIGLASAPPAVRAGDLAARAERRAAARVTVAPDAFAALLPAVRRCYQDALDRDPKLAGTLELAADAAGLRVASGPADEPLRRCVVARLAAAAAAAHAPAVRVELRR